MKVVESKIADLVIKKNKTELGFIYFFEDVLVVEFNEGVHIDYQASREHIDLILDFYKSKPFGYICNRIDKFSVYPLDFSKFNKALNNLTAFCIVCYSEFDRINTEIESMFCVDKPYKAFDTIEDAYYWVKDYSNNESVKR